MRCWAIRGVGDAATAAGFGVDMVSPCERRRTLSRGPAVLRALIVDPDGRRCKGTRGGDTGTPGSILS
ncbi:hypothetical protein GCM10009796_22040 [Microbacterium koreense]